MRGAYALFAPEGNIRKASGDYHPGNRGSERQSQSLLHVIQRSRKTRHLLAGASRSTCVALARGCLHRPRGICLDRREGGAVELMK